MRAAALFLDFGEAAVASAALDCAVNTRRHRRLSKPANIPKSNADAREWPGVVCSPFTAWAAV